LKRVTVEFEFLNETDQDVTVEVAFPVPHFCYEAFKRKTVCAPANFSDFHIWVEGRERSYSRTFKAMLGSHDYTALLQGLGVDLPTHGHFDLYREFFDGEAKQEYDVTKLPIRDQQELIRLGLIDQSSLSPQWDVEEMYHWTQTFPARKVLSVRHQYTPLAGYAPLGVNDLAEERTDWVGGKSIADSCVEPTLRRKLTAEARAAADRTGYLPTQWVDYILTTANNWKTPIRDFELVVEKPPLDLKDIAVVSKWYVSFCWDGPVERVDENHFRARVTNFIPQRELHVGFFGVPLQK